MSADLKGVTIGAGYFSQFHYEAWSRIPNVNICAACDLAEDKLRPFQEQFGIARVYSDYQAMFDEAKPDFVDIITPPQTHEAICTAAAERGLSILCQKPLAPTLPQSEKIAALATKHNVRFMVHENFRFQPWHREIKRLLERGDIGEKLHSIRCQTRLGDGWGPEAYLGRQPYFREMERLLVFETGIHFIDTFRFLAGEMTQVYAKLRQLNSVIKGEDAGILMFEFANGATGLWDCNRYNESNAEDPRFVFGQFLIEGSGGSIRLYEDSRLTIQRLGEPEQAHDYSRRRVNFGGDCVYFTLKHFVDCLKNGKEFETNVEGYLTNIRIQESCYRSNEENRPIGLTAKANT